MSFESMYATQQKLRIKWLHHSLKHRDWFKAQEKISGDIIVNSPDFLLECAIRLKS